MNDIELAEKYGLCPKIDGTFGKTFARMRKQQIEAYTAQIRADERERCAKLCGEIACRDEFDCEISPRICEEEIRELK